MKTLAFSILEYAFYGVALLTLAGFCIGYLIGVTAIVARIVGGV